VRALKIILILVTLVGLAFSGQAQVKEEAFPGDPGKIIVRFFPNPATDYVNVHSEEALMKDVKITVHNIIGNELSVEKEVIDEHEVRVRVKDLPKGYYMLTVSPANSTQRNVFKFLKLESIGL
jgi:hypothetical protein